MKRFDVLAKSATACAALMVIAACGGGGSDGSNAGAPSGATKNEPSLQLSGTAATGAALANAHVSVKCANGNGTATTSSNGAYTLTMTGGALPCIINVKGTQDGVEVSLHSVAEAGSTDSASNTTSAAANVTPLTEMIVAKLSAGLPSDLFAAFSSANSGQVTTAQLSAATNAVLTAIKAAVGVDLGTIDPFKAPLVAATSTNPNAGNGYDKLLDELGTKISVESLPQVVNQIADSAANGGTIATVIADAGKGPLAGCAVALSGKYRTVDFFGRTTVRDIDFKAMTYKSGDGTVNLTVTADATKPCTFAAEGLQGTDQVRYEFAVGASGLGGYQIFNSTTQRSSVGYLIPVQTHAKASLAGSWDMLQSGYVPDDGFVHWPGKLTIAANDKVDVCDINLRNSPQTCTPDAEANLTVADRTDGGMDLLEAGGGGVAQMYGYRAPSGGMVVFGTANPTGANTPQTEQSHFLLTRLQPIVAGAVGSKSSYYDIQFNRVGQDNVTQPPALGTTTLTAVDGSNLTRTRDDGRVDHTQINAPLPGYRHRDAGLMPDGVTPFAELYQFLVPGTGLTVSINAEPTSPTRSHIYVMSFNR